MRCAKCEKELHDCQCPWVKTYSGGKPNYTQPEEFSPGEAKAWLRGYESGKKIRASEGSIQTSDTKPAESARSWVGLTSEELEFYTEELGQGELGRGVLRAVDDFLKEKNEKTKLG
jgi:hypothetical protein